MEPMPADGSLPVSPSPGIRTPVLVDGHVHFHPGFDEGRFFAAAARNFERAARVLDLPPDTPGVLVLTESTGTDHFSGLAARAGSGAVGGPVVATTGEESSLRILLPGSGGPLLVVAGRQLQTAEGLEVLGFPLRPGIPDGLPIRAALAAVTDQGAAAVIPWGFGKWWFARGRLLRRLTGERLPRFLLADTGHRPGWFPVPNHMREARTRGAPVLTGSDPLPLAGQESRAGSSCFRVDMADATRAPGRALVQALGFLAGQPEQVDRRPGPVTFLRTQVAMQRRKRLAS